MKNTLEKAQKQRVLRLSEVMEITALSRSGVYERIKNGGFPKPINLGGRRIGFLESEITEWVESRIRASRGAR